MGGGEGHENTMIGFFFMHGHILHDYKSFLFETFVVVSQNGDKIRIMNSGRYENVFLSKCLLPTLILSFQWTVQQLYFLKAVRKAAYLSTAVYTTTELWVAF